MSKIFKFVAQVKKIFFILCLIVTFPSVCHNIAIIGTGYVGLVVGAGLAELGHNVECVDIDTKKINQLQLGIVPIYEPGLYELVNSTKKKSLLHFTYELDKALKKAEIIFIAVGTPSHYDGSADTSAVKNVIEHIIKSVNPDEHKIICTKSTVPIGFGEHIKELIQNAGKNIDVISNPEFLREGSAIHDFFHPDRIIIGADNEQAATIIENLYSALSADIPIIKTSITTSETIKYASNSFLALKLSYINELAHLCEKTGANIHMVGQGMGLDPRIGPYFLSPGPGFGGSCFPKDIKALLHIAQEYNIQLKTVQAALDANEDRKCHIVELIKNKLGVIKNKSIGIWGVTFKANTDDVRDAPAISIIDQLCAEGATIKVYDPLGNENMRKIFPFLQYCDTKEEVLLDINLLLILTEWDEFKKCSGIHENIPIVDTRNILKKVEH